jgi:excisionase family DNA binding protein
VQTDTGNTQPRNTAPLLNPFPQVTARLGFSRAKLYELIASGQIHPVKVGRRSFIAETELNRFVAALSEVA